MVGKAQKTNDTLHVLFIGNSFTYTNNLPALVAGLAAERGKTLIYSSSTPGGYTLQAHSTYAPTLKLIEQGGWNYVVLQDQSQNPTFPLGYDEVYVYPYAHVLDSIIKEYNPCAKTVFYMTWGYKNGDTANCPGFPSSCTFMGMDSMLLNNYTNMADSNKALLSPVGWVWRRLRSTDPGMNLYAQDGVHPSLEGSYASACSFYSVLCNDDPENNSYTGGLSTYEAIAIQQAAHITVFDSLTHWSRFQPVLKADFKDSVKDSLAIFTNLSQNAKSYSWDFGDGQVSANTQPKHVYTSYGTYVVKLIAKQQCNQADTVSQTITIHKPIVKDSTSGILETKKASGWLNIYPNPALDFLLISDKQNYIERYYITDIVGRIVAQTSGIYASEVKCPTNIFPPGYYMIHIYAGGQENTIGFIKK